MTIKGTVKSVWFWRKGEDGPELLTAWDEYSVEQNEEGFAAEVKRVWELVKDDDAGGGPRHINITFPWEPIERAFWPAEVEGETTDALLAQPEEGK